MMTSLKALAALAAVALAAPATAATVRPAPESTGVACLGTSLTFGGAGTPCSGIWKGNDSNQDVDGLFDGPGIDYDWTEVAKVDVDAGDNDADLGFGLLVDAVAGTWSVSSFLGYETVMVILKGGPTFSAFLIESTEGALGGTFDTQSNLKGNGKRGPGLSHLTLYVTGTPTVPPPSPVPVPAAGLLLVGALGGLGLLRRRRG